MGNWYTNVAVKHVDQTALLRNLETLGRSAIVSPTQSGWVTVFDEECDNFDLDVLESLALTLTTQLHCAALPCLNADDDVLWFAVYENGRRLSRYASSTEQFEDALEFPGIPQFTAELCRLFQKPDRVPEVSRILRAGHGGLGLLRHFGARIAYLTEIERHAELANVLNLPSASMGLGYTYVARGELATDTDPGGYLKTGSGQT